MAKYFIFYTDTNQLAALADSEENKNKFIAGQTLYTAVEVTDSQYDDVKLGRKTTQLSNGSALVSDFETGSFGTISATQTLEDIKMQIKIFIEDEITYLQKKLVNYPEYENALRAIDVDSLSSAPNQTIQNWVLSQINIPFKRAFEV